MFKHKEGKYMNLKKVKKMIFSFSSCLLFMFLFHINLFAQYLYESTTTDGQYIYHTENNKIYKYDMQGNNKTEIYEGLPYGIIIENIYGNYLYFNECTAEVDGTIDANCNLKVLNTNDNTCKVINDMYSRVKIKGNKLYITRGVQGDYGPDPLYCADIDGNNYKLITEISNLHCKIINNQLYYTEFSPNYNWTHRVIKSDLDGSNPEIVIDWFDSHSAYADDKGVIWSTYINDKRISFIKDYETKQDIPFNEKDNYQSFRFSDDYLYSYTHNSKTKKENYIFFKVTEEGEKIEVERLKDCSDHICFLSIVDGKLYYTIGDNLDVKFIVLEDNSDHNSIVEGLSYPIWKQNDFGWWLENQDGSYLTNTWYQSPDSGLWYYMGADGYMLTNTVTPDGYRVGMDGVWVQ